MNARSDLANSDQRIGRKKVHLSPMALVGLLFLCTALILLLVVNYLPGLQASPKSGDILVDETFDGKYQWQTFKVEAAAIDVSNGDLSINLNKTGNFYTIPFEGMRGGPHDFFLISDPQTTSLVRGNVDMTFEVTVEHDAGTGSQFGATCRYQDEQNFYSFILVDDGRFSIFKEVNDNITNLHPWTFSEAIHIGEAKNKALIICSADQLQLEVNGTKLAAVTDTDLKIGKIALLAGAGDVPGVTISFDNLVIRLP